jgi:toxin ParE1/3/4
MAKLIWSPRALADLDSACEFISRDSPRYASLFVERIVAAIEGLSLHPLLGAIVPEYGMEEIRERLFQNYRIIYRVSSDLVEIVAIIHAARLLPMTLPG